MAHILGISAYFHDSAACLLEDGVVVAAAEEERFSRVKHDASFPHAAIAFCLRAAGIEISDITLVVFYEKPLVKLRRIVATQLANAPRGYEQFRRSIPHWLRRRVLARRELRRALGDGYRGRYLFTEHHEAHAASAFYPSPFAVAAVVTIDAVGEWTTTSIALGRGRHLRMLQELRFPHSLGLLYSAFTAFTGFRVNSGEYKLMGLAPYGKPVYRETILRELVDLQDDGSFRLHMRYFAFDRSDHMTTSAFTRLFGGPPRDPDAPITTRETDLAASIQSVTDEVVLRIARHARRTTGADDLALAGGVALNCVTNGRLLRAGVFQRVWVQPAAGDSGGALGCALFAWHHVLGRPRLPVATDAMQGSFLGPWFDSSAIRRYLRAVAAPFHDGYSETELCEQVAALIAEGKVVAHFAGRMEFGPRALGNRSILADARDPGMQRALNLRIKFRESFRPFAPVVTREQASRYFVLPDDLDSPYMSFVAQVRPGRTPLPAVTHVDGSARVQTADRVRHPRLHGVLRAFEALTGTAVLINTSLNVRGEPIVHTPAEAYQCLMSTGIDALVLEDVLVLRDEQPGANARPARVAAD
jgi:carbamoyltransferase